MGQANGTKEDDASSFHDNEKMDYSDRSVSMYEENDEVMTIHDNWGGRDEVAMRAAVFCSFLRIETFKDWKF